MFIVSMKASKRRLIPVMLCIALIAAMLIAGLCFPASRTMMTSSVVWCADDAACATYLPTLGYQAVLPVKEVREIALPDAFDEALSAYNALQQQGGFDLSLYAGQRVKYRTYTLEEHPSGTAAVAHLYIYDDRLIGGDISAADGSFTEPLCPATDSTEPAC